MPSAHWKRGFFLSESTRILGIDPGTRLCGWGLIECAGGRITHVDNGVFVLGESTPLPQRLATLLDGLEVLIREHRPDEAAVEGIFQHRNARTALILGHARGVALAAIARHGLAVHEYSPQQVKKAVTGSGRAAKEQVQQMVGIRLKLVEVPQEDAADAVAVAMCHGQHLVQGHPMVGAPPKRRGGKRKAAAALEALVMAQQRGQQ